MDQKTLEQRRLEFDGELRTLLGTKNTYFEPPANVRMQYPCVVYSRSGIYDTRADDLKYLKRQRFSVTVIDTNPDTEWPQMILDHFPYARFDRPFSADRLAHYVISVYY